jgi:hypothetical protein
MVTSQVTSQVTAVITVQPSITTVVPVFVTSSVTNTVQTTVAVAGSNGCISNYGIAGCDPAVYSRPAYGAGVGGWFGPP